jgi:hypothetical protein
LTSGGGDRRFADVEVADMDTSERPDGITEEHLLYLDGLRESGITNMYGATPYVMEEFDISKAEASKIHLYWMKSFGNPKR